MFSSSVQTKCPKCHHRIKILKKDLGKNTKCPHCHEFSNTHVVVSRFKKFFPAWDRTPSEFINSKCRACKNTFQIVRERKGTTVTCPLCDAKTKVSEYRKFKVPVAAIMTLSALALIIGIGAYLGNHLLQKSGVDENQEVAFQTYIDALEKKEFEKLETDILIAIQSESISKTQMRELATKLDEAEQSDLGYELFRAYLKKSPSDDLEDHKRMIAYYLAGRKLLIPEQDDLEKRLVRAIALDPEDQKSLHVLTQLYNRRGKTDEIVELYLGRGVDSIDDQMQLVYHYIRMNESEKAESICRRVLKQSTTHLLTEPDNLSVRIAAIQAALILKNYEIVSQLYEAGQRTFGYETSEDWNQIVSRLFYRQVKNSQEEGAKENKEIQEQFFQCITRLPLTEKNKSARRDKEFMQSIWKLSLEDSAVGEKCVSSYWRLLARNHQPDIVLQLLADRRFVQERPADAAVLWASALAYKADDSFMINNLAWVWAWSNPPRLEQALELAKQAVKDKPKMSAFRGTYGQVLARLGEHRLAFNQLQLALQESKGNGRLHATMVEVSEKLEMKEIAKEHRKILGELSEKLEDYQPIDPEESKKKFKTGSFDQLKDSEIREEKR